MVRPLKRTSVCVFLLAFTIQGCASSHIKPYEPKRRDYQLPVVIPEGASRQAGGSLWSSSSRANVLFADQRAMQLGDIVTVKVEEFADAKRGASTTLQRQSELNAEIGAFLGAMQKLKEIAPGLDPERLVDAAASSKFSGSGSTGRSERLEATVPAIVRQELPNGNLFVEGHRVVLVNEEEHHFYLSGVVRPQDIDETNTISSSRLADAEVEFTGRGVLTQQQEQGWFAEYFGWLWPF